MFLSSKFAAENEVHSKNTCVTFCLRGISAHRELDVATGHECGSAETPE